ncbi:MAG: HAD family hydrolase, partial [Planctomycetes bacterium]|nr:HAD family hydrolase [Planctomycetota bacterium]
MLDSVEKAKAVLFDLDGTLLDTIEDLAECMNAVVAEAGFPTSPLARHKLMVGDGLRNYAIQALPVDCRGNAVLIDRVVQG